MILGHLNIEKRQIFDKKYTKKCPLQQLYTTGEYQYKGIEVSSAQEVRAERVITAVSDTAVYNK